MLDETVAHIHRVTWQIKVWFWFVGVLLGSGPVSVLFRCLFSRWQNANLVGDLRVVWVVGFFVFSLIAFQVRPLRLRCPWLSWYGGTLVADRLLVVVRFPAGPRVSLKW